MEPGAVSEGRFRQVDRVAIEVPADAEFPAATVMVRRSWI